MHSLRQGLKGKYSMILLIGIIYLSMQVGGFAQNPQLDAFDELWTGIETSFPSTDSQQLSWGVIKQRYRKKIAAVYSPSAMANLINVMFAEMGISHMKLSSDDSITHETRTQSGTGYLGFDLHWINDHWYVQSLDPSSNAAQAGLANGDELLALNGRVIPSQSSRFSMEVLMGVKRKLFGKTGEKVKVTHLDAQGKQKTVTVECISWPGAWSAPFGNMPSIPIRFVNETVRNVKVLRFSNWVMDINQQILQGLQEAKDCSGLVIDLRGNTGGLGFMANGIAGRLSDKAFSMGSMFLKKGNINFYVHPQANPYMGEIVVLIDQFSASTSEIFAIGLQESDRALIVGNTSMGAALPSKFVKLDNGLIFQQAIATLISSKGRQIEGNGVDPDYSIYKKKDDLIHGRDPVLSFALDWILNYPNDN